MFTDQAVSCPIVPFLGALTCSAGFWSIGLTERSIRTTSEAGERVQPILSEEISPMHLHLGRFYISTYYQYPKNMFQVNNKNLQLHMHSGVWGLWCVCVGVKLFSWQPLQNRSEEYLYCCLNSLSLHHVPAAPSHSMEITSKDKSTGTMWCSEVSLK